MTSDDVRRLMKERNLTNWEMALMLKMPVSAFRKCLAPVGSRNHRNFPESAARRFQSVSESKELNTDFWASFHGQTTEYQYRRLTEQREWKKMFRTTAKSSEADIF